MDVLQAVLPFIGIILALVVLHELGHFVVAKLAGVRIEEFGVGIPPRIWGKRIGETVYSLNWLPIGGFVRPTGEDSARVFVASVNAHGAAERAGIQPGDVITHVKDGAVHSEAQLAARLNREAGIGLIPLTIQREEQTAGGSELVEHDLLLTLPETALAALAADADNAPAAPAAPGAKESPAAAIGRIAGVSVSPDPKALGSKSPYVRILVLAAGAAVNAILPIFLFAIAALIPQSVPAGPALITSVIAGGPASDAGLQAGDRFLSVNGTEIRNAADLSRAIQLHLGEDIDVVVERDVPQEGVSQRQATVTETVRTSVRARLAPQSLRHVVQPGEDVHIIAQILGVNAGQVLAGAGLGGDVDLPDGITLTLPDGETHLVQPGDTAVGLARDLGLRTAVVLKAAGIDLVHLEPGTKIEVPQGPTGITITNGSAGTVKESEGFFSAIGSGWNETIDTLVLVRNRLRSWIAGGEGIQLSGPVGIAQITGEVIEQAGWLRLLELAALISLNLAILNILPLPMLDGGRITFVLLEIVRRGKRISPEKEGLVHLTGFALFITFVVVISYFDIIRAVAGESALR